MECRRESVQSSTVVPRGSIPGRAGRCSDRYLLEKLVFFYPPPPTEALRGSLFFGSRRGQGLLRRTRDAPAGPSTSRRPGHRRLEHASHTRTWWRALCSCASWLCTQRAASSNRIFARALPGFPVSTEHLPRPEVVTLGLYGKTPGGDHRYITCEYPGCGAASHPVRAG